MQTKPKLFLIEGICGSGKSTLAGRLNDHLLANGFSSSFFDEGAKNHPASLNWHAFYRRADYEELLSLYPEQAEAIQAEAIFEDDFILIPYRDIHKFEQNPKLYQNLKEHELCWTDKPAASASEYSTAIQRQWKRFAVSVRKSQGLFVLEGVFLQHPIHDLLRMYHADDGQIFGHIGKVAEQLKDICPILFYLSQPSVREHQIRIAQIRSKPHNASDERIRFMEERKKKELTLIGRLPFQTYVLENDGNEWDNVLQRMAEIVNHHVFA